MYRYNTLHYSTAIQKIAMRIGGNNSHMLVSKSMQNTASGLRSLFRWFLPKNSTAKLPVRIPNEQSEAACQHRRRLVINIGGQKFGSQIWGRGKNFGKI